MLRIILFVLLLTVVYSWDELRSLAGISFRRLGRKPSSDQIVADIVLLATIPLTLIYLIGSGQQLWLKLSVLFIEFVVIGLVLRGIEEFSRRKRFLANYEFDALAGNLFAVAGLVSPTIKFASNIGRSSHLGKYLLDLALPFAIGLALILVSVNLNPAEFADKMNLLIIIAVFGIMLNFVIDLLEKLLRHPQLRLSSFYRIVLGIVIIGTLAVH